MLVDIILLVRATGFAISFKSLLIKVLGCLKGGGGVLEIRVSLQIVLYVNSELAAVFRASNTAEFTLRSNSPVASLYTLFLYAFIIEYSFFFLI
jgi:hypothetical protein